MRSSAADCGPTDEAMILESQVLSLNAPALQTFKDFKRWFMSAATPVLWGRDEQLYDDEEDVVALAPVDSDRLNRFLKSYLGWLFRVNNAFQIENFLESRLVYLPERRRNVRFLAGMICSTSQNDESSAQALLYRSSSAQCCS